MASTVILTAMCAIGTVFVFGAGYFDMSIGGSLCVAAVLGGMAMIASGSFLVGFLAILAVSVVLAVIKGLLASYVNVPFFIFTIILSSIFSALVFKFTPLGIKAKNMGGSCVCVKQFHAPGSGWPKPCRR